MLNELKEFLKRNSKEEKLKIGRDVVGMALQSPNVFEYQVAMERYFRFKISNSGPPNGKYIAIKNETLTFSGSFF